MNWLLILMCCSIFTIASPVYAGNAPPTKPEAARALNKAGLSPRDQSGVRKKLQDCNAAGGDFKSRYECKNKIVQDADIADSSILDMKCRDIGGDIYTCEVLFDGVELSKHGTFVFVKLGGQWMARMP